MPQASGAKYHYLDHDTDFLNMVPPVQNAWYQVFDAEDVRLIWCCVFHSNTGAVAKDIQVRWTIDGNVYLIGWSVPSGVVHSVYRYIQPSTGGTQGLGWDGGIMTAGYRTDKRGQRFKVEVRMTSAPGVNEDLRCWCVRETLEPT